MPKYADLHPLPEDARIALICQAASGGQIVGVFLEKNERAKIARYIRKVTAQCPSVVLLQQIDGPTPLVVTLRFGRQLPSHQDNGQPPVPTPQGVH